MFVNDIPVYQLDWDPITVEAYSEKSGEAIMVFNFDITTADKMTGVVQYVVGRVAWGCKNLPLSTDMRLKFDFRGQGIVASKKDFFKDQILSFLNKINITDRVSFEFLI